MNDKRTKRKSSWISRRILTRYILSVLGLGAAALAYLIVWQLLEGITWQADNPLYQLLKILQWIAPVIVLIALILLTRHYLLVPLGYLDEVIDATEKLSHPDSEPVKLSDPLIDVQNELNLAREHALRDAASAREAEQRKNDLIVYLAHDLKTPLTSVIDYLTLLRDEPQVSPELRAKYTGIALDKAERLEDLINEFFDITRFNLIHLTLDKETVSLSRMLEQVTSEFDPLLAEKELTWDAHIEPNVQLVCDPDKLERVFDNLLCNAVNYSYPKTSIFISLEQADDKVTVQMKNHGKTIPPEKLGQIFEQFYRLDSSRSSTTGGSGLGLAIAKGIIDLHGGTISAESVDESIAFTVTLPKSRQKIV